MESFEFKLVSSPNTRSMGEFLSLNGVARYIGLSAAFCRKHDILQKYEYALTFLDLGKNVLGLKFLTKEEEVKGARLITKGKSSASVSAASLFNALEKSGLNLGDCYGQYGKISEYNDPINGLIFYVTLGEKE